MHPIFAIYGKNKKKQRMKKTIIFASAVIVFGATSCNRQQQETAPGEVAVRLFTAITSGEMQVVKENIYMSDSIQRSTFYDWIDAAKNSPQYKENTAGFKADYTVAEEHVDGDNAEVILSGTGPLGQKVRITVKLKKIDGEWKVDGDHGVWQ